MHSIEVYEKDMTIHIPEHWDEATAEQACRVFEFAFNHFAGLIDQNRYYTEMLFFLTGMKRSWRTKVWERLAPEELVLEKNAKIYQMGETLCMWPFVEDSKTLTIKYETVRNNLPVITIGRKKLYGPTDLLADITFGEFRTAVTEMQNHFRLAKDADSADQADEALNRFIACLYRPAKVTRTKSNEDPAPKVREPFNRETLTTRFTSKMTIWQKTMILLWFTYCVKYLQTEDLIIEGNLVNLSVLFPEANKGEQISSDDEPSASGTGWAGLLFGISETGVFGDTKETDRTGFFDILLYMYNNHLKQQKQKRKS